MSETEALPRVEIVPYDPRWPYAYAAERAELVSIGGSAIIALEHIGSTSVPGLSAKPIIDMMAAVIDLEIGHVLAARFEGNGYRLIETGMRNRLFLRRPFAVDCGAFHLHIVELAQRKAYARLPPCTFRRRCRLCRRKDSACSRLRQGLARLHKSKNCVYPGISR